MNPETLRVGYVVKRYPRFSETFIVNEILAHEAAGHSLEIFSIYPPSDTHFQDIISKVRAPVTYLHGEGIRSADFWMMLQQSARENPGFWPRLEDAELGTAQEVFQASWLARIVRERRIGHLHAHFASTAASVARLAARFADITYSFTAHVKDIFHNGTHAEDIRRKLSNASAMITVSDFNMRFLQQRYGQAAVKVKRIYNGIHLDRFPYNPPINRPPRIVAVGRLVEKKGFDVLINAAALLDKAGVNFTCDIVGAGELEAILHAKAHGLNLSNRVRFLGPLPQAEVIRELQNAAICAVPCVVGNDGNADELPTVLLEAMALGTPCVSTSITGIPEVIQNERTGLLTEQRNAASLGSALRRLLEDPRLGSSLAENARQLIEREFDAQKNAREQFALFVASQQKRQAAARLQSQTDYEHQEMAERCA